MEPLKTLIETLYPIDRYLLGTGYDTAVEYLKHLLPFEVIKIPSGTKVGTWTVPDEWVIRDAWVIDPQGNKIIDFKTDPLSVSVGSLPFKGKVTLEELKKHWVFSDDRPDATPFSFKYYDRDWTFCVPKNKVREKIIYDDEGNLICEDGICIPKTDIDPSVGKVQIEGLDWKPEFKDKIEEGEYEVVIDSEDKPGVMKLLVHTIPGKSKREVLLFAHLDHPYQANDNLSGVACLMDVATKIKCDHTIKIVICPETIGSIAYAETQDISKVDFVIAVDICGNDNTILLQKSFDSENKLNRAAHVALKSIGDNYRKASFRGVIGSDEYVFNDPMIGIPGILLSRTPYKEYHTSEDTPEKINYENIVKTSEAVMKIIEVWEKDFIPKRNITGPLMRSKYGIQTISPQVNLSWDYLWYSMDGKVSVAEFCCEYGLDFDTVCEALNKMEYDKTICRIDDNKGKKRKTSK